MKVGERATVKDKDGHHLGTVLFVGSIPGKEGTWVGLEWDDISRGKHEGSVQGTQYFKCLRGPNSASFVRSDKVKPGISLTEAIRQRYTPGVENLERMSVQTVGNRSLDVELAGTAKVLQRLNQLNLLTQASFDDMRLSCPVSSR